MSKEGEKDYNACELDTSKLELLIKGYGTKEKDKKVATFENILLLANPPNPPDSEQKVTGDWTKKVASEPANAKSLLHLNPLSKDTFVLSKEDEVTPSNNTKPTFTTATLDDDVDEIFTKIHLNRSKIKFLQAQLFMLNTFYTVGFEKLNTEARTSILKETSAAGQEKVPAPTPIFDMLEDLPCKLGEMKFLLNLLRETNERSGTKM